MPANFKDHIFIFDLHNTLYDEVIEYGGAMQAAIDYLAQELQTRGKTIDQDSLYNQIAKAHAELGSDWDDDVWQHLDVLEGIKDKNTIIKNVIDKRAHTSEKLTKEHAYKDTIDAVRNLKEQGAKIYLATEATANAAADAVRWLGLDGIIDAVYSWPYAKLYRKLEKTGQKHFPRIGKNDLQKPHPYILAAIILDTAKADLKIDANIALEDVFELRIDEELDVAPLINSIPKDSIQGKEAVNAIRTRISIKGTQYKETLENYWTRTYYIGDSFFKDGFLARNADILFIHAAYGKKTTDPKALEKAKKTLYAVTGWEPFLLQLTQEASKLPDLTAHIRPCFFCKESFQEFIT